MYPLMHMIKILLMVIKLIRVIICFGLRMILR